MIDFDVGLRSEKNFTLRELSRRSGVSATQISEIERNLSAPTIPTLLKIISGLDAAATAFFDTKRKKSVSIVRKNERHEFIDHKNNVFIQYLSNGIIDSKTKIFLAHPPPGIINIRGGYKHDGEEFITVIKGLIQVILDDKKYILREGDSIHFQSDFRHTIQNITDQKVEILVVISQPNH